MDQKKKVDWTVLSLTAAAFSDWFLFGMTKEIQSETQLMCQSLSECGSETVRGRTRRLDALLSERSLEEHAQDWAKTFALGAQSTTPHESVFRSGLVMQESRDQTLAWMRSMGLGRAEGVNEPEDHAGFQLAIFGKQIERPTLRAGTSSVVGGAPEGTSEKWSTVIFVCSHGSTRERLGRRDRQ